MDLCTSSINREHWYVHWGLHCIENYLLDNCIVYFSYLCVFISRLGSYVQTIQCSRLRVLRWCPPPATREPGRRVRWQRNGGYSVGRMISVSTLGTRSWSWFGKWSLTPRFFPFPACAICLSMVIFRNPSQVTE